MLHSVTKDAEIKQIVVENLDNDAELCFYEGWPAKRLDEVNNAHRRIHAHHP